MVPVGKIIRAHGVRGGVKVYPYGESFEAREEGESLFILTDEGYRPLTLRRIQRQHRCWILTFVEITDRNRAESLIGAELFVPERELPETGEGEYYYYQLIGLDVVSQEGDYLGTLTGIIETGANDV
ncbi:16S rRNA processing protein RimM [Thermodesulforhabdus norvegica]|uniref:16S rRNA processing protein RimM n=1 Tax=Thermodesulforhabdus norvegica TaxID=39841 RepID=A0A1I4QZT5_9BACT|nr:16S rRNA processing protein RimM [Thermodesulforhabdus norvegica]